MSTYKAALIGCGKRGLNNARTIQAMDKLDLIAVVDPNREAAEAAKLECGNENTATYTDHKEMLQKEQPDFCAICVWTGLHLPLFRDCAEAGVKAVFLEKPMAGTWGECKEIARIAEETGCRLSFSHQRRFDRGNQNAREMIADGLFGDIIRLDLYSPCGLLDCGTHTLDQAFSFLGDKVGVQWVLGAADTSEIREHFAIPEAKMFAGTLMYENGIMGNLYCNKFPGQDHWSGVKVFGTKGYMVFDWGGEVIQYAIFDQPDFVPPALEEDKFDPMISSYEDVLRSMESDEENELHVRKALRAAEVIFAFYESVRTRRRIELPLTGVEGHPLVDMLKERE